MDKELHLFYIGSYSHVIVANAIINEKKLPLDAVFFVTYRGVKLPQIYEKNLLIDESNLNRKKYFITHFFNLNKLIKGEKICGYFPFQGQFPIRRFFDNYVFFEEGLSAYDKSIDYSRFKKGVYFKQLVKHILIAPFFNKNYRGLLNGRQNGSPFSFKCKLVGLTESSYKNVIIDECEHETVHFTSNPLRRSSIANSFIIVMDSTHASDRMDSVDNYLKILAESLSDLNIGPQKVYLKLHPDNHRDSKATINLIKKYVDFLSFDVIDESLEDIALSNQNNVFFGNHSTILFYAPIFGNSNKSISFVRMNAARDKTYAQFLQRWGGVEESIELFKQQMECL